MRDVNTVACDMLDFSVFSRIITFKKYMYRVAIESKKHDFLTNQRTYFLKTVF